MRTRIIVRETFPGKHRWPFAPEAVAFLRDGHRHRFHIVATIDVRHDDRELEFFLVQRDIRAWIADFDFDLGSLSCEQLGASLIAHLQRHYGVDRSYQVEISEDGENGALVNVDAAS